MNDITVIVLTKNEESNIKRCLESVRDWVDRIIVVDSGSSDRTVDIASGLGADIYFHEPFINYAKQFNWAIDNTHLSTKWVFRLDADEVVPVELRDEIVDALNKHKDGFQITHHLNSHPMGAQY